MKLQILDVDCLALLRDKACINATLNKYISHKNNKWLDEVCDKNPFIDTKYTDLPDIVFDMSAKKPEDTDFENVKRVYSALKFLSDSNASEERLWAAMCLGPGYQYVQYRWPVKTSDNVLQHFYYGYGGRRSLTRNAIARLWWIGRLTYDKDRKDPYELTRYVCSAADHIMHFIERNTSNNLHVLRPVIEAILEAREKGYDVNTDDAGTLSKYLNILGGMYILDAMPEEWIKKKIANKITEIVKIQEVSDENVVAISGMKKVKSDSKVVLQCENGQKILINAKKNKLKTIPTSLVGLNVGDMVKIGKLKYNIIDVR